MNWLVLPLLVWCFSCNPSQALTHPCPAPFSLEAEKCVLVNTSRSYTWCSASRVCASMGGELVNSYSTIQAMSSIPSLACSCHLWFGVTDLADERDSDRSGWQRINSRGILPVDNSIWMSGMPNNNGNQDCVSQSSVNTNVFYDARCSARRGFACEFLRNAQSQLPYSASSWKRTPFKRTSYNPSTEYCYTDLLQVKDAISCVAAAMRDGSSRHVLYNSRLRTCRLLQFTDAQVEQEIETSDDWVKFALH